jgi:hypothetical protein
LTGKSEEAATAMAAAEESAIPPALAILGRVFETLAI